LFWDSHGAAIVRQCSGELWTINEHVAKVWNVNRVRHEPGGGISSNPNTVREGGNSGFQAVGLALLFGCERVTLLGFDMQFSKGRRHWHADHAKNNPIAKSFPGWIASFNELSRMTSIRIENASRETAIKCFPRVDLEEALS
jgi:hypothetical protein